jgi:hypothetical protein
MPVDPFLFAHKVGPFHINIGGQWSPLSIRDQMLRGRWAAERALDAGILGEGKELAVIGAGVGGVTAAMVAVNAGVKTTLFDKDSDPFARHKKCRRWVDPTQYDWPLDHFNAGSIPWTPRQSLPPVTIVLSSTPPMPLRWPRATRALALVGDWISQFNSFTLTPNALKYFTWNHDCEVTNIGPHATGTMAEVTWHPVGLHGSSFTDPFGLVISAMGFGEECNYLEYPKGTISPVRGYSFWDSDPFENPGLDWHGTLRRPRVLISGGGDGALQDFIRIATKFKSALDLWNHLSLSTSDSAAIRKAVQDIEDQAARSLPWSANSKHDHAVLDRVRAGLDALATQVRLLPTISAALSTAVRREYSKLWLVHSCNHFNPSYSLNRFLSLLLIKQLPYEGVGFAYLPGYRLKALRCTHGAPTIPDPALCHWQDHKATFAPHLDCRTAFAPLTTDPTIEEDFNVLVLRHGIDPPPLHLMGGTAATIMPSRQVLPYHYPG